MRRHLKKYSTPPEVTALHRSDSFTCLLIDMLNIQRICCPFDYSRPARKALEHAIFLADWHDAALHLIRIDFDDDDEIEYDPNVDSSEVLPEDELEANLRGALGETRRQPEIVQARWRASSSRDAIVAYAEGEAIDLIVMGTHGRQGLERWLLGSTAEGVVRLAPCPVLTLGKDESRAARRGVERILAPVDFSDSTHPALAYTRHLAQTYGARIDLVHVVAEEVPALAYGHHTDLSNVEAWADDAQKRLEQLARDEIGYEHVQVSVLRGHAAAEVLTYVEDEKIDLIVVSTHGRTGVERLLLGSTAERLVRSASCPVFTIKTFGKSLLPASSSRMTD